MKKFFDKFNLKNIDEDIKKKVFFGFYFVFFLVILIFIVISNNTPKVVEKCTDEKATIKDQTRNYSFWYEITTKDSVTVLSGSRTDYEIKINKRINDIETDYYTYYDNTYIYQNNKWNVYSGNIIDNFDLNLINVEYINDVARKTDIISNENNVVKLYNKPLDMNMEYVYKTDNHLKYIQVVKGDISIVLKFFDIGLIEDFNINVDE